MILTVPTGDKELWPTLGPQLCDWIQANLVYGPGDLRGLPVELTTEQRFLIYRMYEIYPQNHAQAGRRRFKRCALSLRKGVGKTEFSAWISACELHPNAPVRCVGWNEDGEPIGDGVRDPYIPMMATNEEQTEELAYGALKAILEESAIASDFDIGYERIMRRGGDGKAEAVATSPNANDGARTSFQLFDESHRFTLPRIKAAHTTMMMNTAKRPYADAWSLEITTAPEPGAGSVAEDTYDYAVAIREGRAKDARLFFYHRQASIDIDIEDDEGLREAIIEASGPDVAEWADVDAIVSLFRDPTTDRAYAERVWLNRLVKGSNKAFDVVKWNELGDKDFSVPDGSLIVLGFDGSRYNDSTALVATHVESGFQWVAGLWERPYNAPDSWEVPVDEVDETVAYLFETFDVWRMYCDPPYWETYVAKWAGQYGEKRVIEWWTNRTTQMAYALKAFKNSIDTGERKHSGDPRLARHIGNAHKRELSRRDEEGNPLWWIQKDRSDSPYKIDAAMAAVLSDEAYRDCIASGEPGTRSVYESRGLLTVEL